MLTGLLGHPLAYRGSLLRATMDYWLAMGAQRAATNDYG
jgi:hypothetical protein